MKTKPRTELVDAQVVINLRLPNYIYRYDPDKFKSYILGECREIVDQINNHKDLSYHNVSTELVNDYYCPFCNYYYGQAYPNVMDCCEEVIEAQNV